MMRKYVKVFLGKKILTQSVVSFILICFSLAVAAQSDRLIIPEDNIYQIPEDFANEEVVSLHEATYFLPDPENRISPESILQPEIYSQFQPKLTKLHLLEMTNGTYWFRIKIIGNSSDFQEYFLNYPSPYAKINVFVQEGDQLQLWDQAGFDQKAGNSFLSLGNDNARLILHQGEEKTFYLQCIEGILPADFAFYTLSLAPFEKAYSTQLAVWWWVRIPIVVFATLIVYHLILYLRLKKRLYLFMCILLFGLMVNTPVTNLIMYQWLSPVNHFGMNSLEFGVLMWVIMMMGILFFIREVLDLQKHLPKWDQIIKALIFLILLNLGFTFLNRAANLAGNLYPKYFIGLPIRTLLATIGAIVTLVISFIRWRQGSSSAPWFFLAMSIPLIAMVGFAFFNYADPGYYQVFDLKRSIIPNLSFAAIAIFVAISLSERIKDMDRQRNESQLNRRLALAEADRLRELDTLKSRLYTNITHEFRTPLTVILGLTDQINGHEKETKLIRRNGKNLLNLINQMLDLSRFEAGQIKLDIQQSDIIPFLSYISRSFHSLAYSQKINVSFYSPEETLVMDYDQEKVRQILSNLITNAIKFTPEYGEVQVVVKRVDNMFLLSVRDTGIGISPEELPKIFNRFQQVDPSSTRSGEGTGIGLAIVKEMVKLMDGKIEVKSELKKGSEFIVTLPISNEGPMERWHMEEVAVTSDNQLNQALIEDASEELIDTKPLLLIIEDNQDVVYYLKILLQKQYQLLIAHNGVEGIEKAFEQMPDIIISDVMMPQKDGYQVCEELKKDKRTSHIPIILLTAKGDIASKRAGLQTGADAYLAKPFDQEELFIRLQKLIDLRQKLKEKYLDVSLENMPAEVIENDVELQFLQKLEEVLRDNLANEDFRVNPHLCQAMLMSRPQLYRKIKALKDISPSEYIRQFRLREARRLLLQTNEKIGDIASLTGYRDSSYFSKVYAAEFGETPGETRKNH